MQAHEEPPDGRSARPRFRGRGRTAASDRRSDRSHAAVRFPPSPRYGTQAEGEGGTQANHVEELEVHAADNAAPDLGRIELPEAPGEADFETDAHAVGRAVKALVTNAEDVVVLVIVEGERIETAIGARRKAEEGLVERLWREEPVLRGRGTTQPKADRLALRTALKRNTLPIAPQRTLTMIAVERGKMPARCHHSASITQAAA
jgi:hypothetical protein